MRHKGVSGAEILQRLAETNEHFDSKTAFSQRKFIRRKANVHVRLVRVERVSAQALLAAQMDGAIPTLSLAKAVCIRWDAASMLLSLANVRPQGRALVFDDTLGCMSALVHQRQAAGGLALVCARHGRSMQGLSALNCDLEKVLCFGNVQIRPSRRKGAGTSKRGGSASAAQRDSGDKSAAQDETRSEAKPETGASSSSLPASAQPS